MSVKPVSITLHDGYLDVILQGVSRGTHSHYLEIHDEIFAASRESHCGRILIDGSQLDYTPNVLLEHQTAMDLAARCASHPFHVIVAAVAPANSTRANEHLETAARNRGANIRLFLNREDAVAWLTAPDS